MKNRRQTTDAGPKPGNAPLGLPEAHAKPARSHQEEKLQLELLIKELRRSNEVLEASRNKYALLYDFAPVGYLTIDSDGVIQAVNQTGISLLGMDRPSIVNHPFELFVAEDDLPIYADFHHKVFQSKVKETCRLQLSNRIRPLVVRIEATVTETGEEYHAVLVDITERRRAEEALRESEYNLSKAQTMSHVGSWRSNPATGELVVSDELLRILGLNREEATQDAFMSVIHPEDLEMVMGQLQEGIERGESYEIEHRLLLRDGTEKWVYTIVEPSANSHGKIVRLYGTTQDITDRKQVEVTLQNQRNEFQAIFDSVKDGVIVFDQRSLVQHHNHVCRGLFPQKVLFWGSCRDIFHYDNPSFKNCPVERALRGERVETSIVLKREGGHDSRYLDVTATPIQDAQGQHNRALVFFRDVTEKRMQELQLIQAEKMSSIGILAAGVAHEINNPLTSVAGYAEALLRRFRELPELAADPNLRTFPKYLEVIVRESYHCKGIIDNLLNFSRKSDGYACELDLGGILSEIVELLLHQPGAGQIRIVTRLEERLSILGDPSGMRQVFMNLLYNAFQSIKEGGVIEIATGHSEDGAEVEVNIKDTGCGIAPEVIDRIWDPFFTTKEVGKGVGLGLALTYNIVKRHGGTISVESKVNEGSLFTVRLPACPDGATSKVPV